MTLTCGEGLNIYAHRLFGPQPRTSTYICIWEISQGSLYCDLTADGLKRLIGSLGTLATGLADKENALPSDFVMASDPDMTFLSVHADSIQLRLHADEHSVANVRLPQGFSVAFDDFACTDWLKHVDFIVPFIDVKVLAQLVPEKQPSTWNVIGSATSDLRVLAGITEPSAQAIARRQRDFVEVQDAMTRRCPHLYGAVHRAKGDC